MNQAVKYAVFLATGQQITAAASYADTKAEFERLAKTSWQTYGCGVHMDRADG